MVMASLGWIWAPVIAALGASVLTTVGLLVRDWLVGRRRQRAERLATRLAAYQALLTQSIVALHAASTLRLTMKVRSGLKERWDLTLRQRKPLDPFDLADRLLRDFQPLFAAWTSVWAEGTAESIPLANELVERCLALTTMATELGQAGGALKRYLLGQRWTVNQEEAYSQAQMAVGDARRRLAELLRDEGGETAVDLRAVSTARAPTNAEGTGAA